MTPPRPDVREDPRVLRVGEYTKRLTFWEGDHDHVPPDLVGYAVDFLRQSLGDVLADRAAYRNKPEKADEFWTEAET